MKMQRLQIKQQLVQIRVDTQMASLSVEMPKRTMAVERHFAQMAVERETPKIELDMEDFRNNIGLKSIYTLTEETAVRAQAQATQSIRGITNDGSFVGALPSNGNPIAQLARSKMLEVKTSGTSRNTVPGGAIKMGGNPGAFNINWTKHSLKINWDALQSPKLTVEPKASVDVNIVQEPSIEYTVVEQTIPAETGKTIDVEA